MEHPGAPEITVETAWRTILVTDARDSSKAYFSERSDEALVRIEGDRALFARVAVAHGGEEARDRGDGSMFAFPDPAAALRAAMMMQSEMARINDTLPAHALRLVHRMGIQMGSVKIATTGGEVPKRKLSGDIVVTAARLEAICHPGEVLFTNDVYRAVKGSIDHEFRFLDATLKGFDRPVRVWSTRLDRDWVRPLSAEEETAKVRQRAEQRLRERWDREQREKRRRKIALAGSAWAALISLGCAAASLASTQEGFVPTVNRLRDALHDPSSDTTVVRTQATETIVAEPAPSEAVARRQHWTPVPAVTDTHTPVRLASLPVVPRRAAATSTRATRSQITLLMRKTLNQGRFEDLPSRLLEMGLSMSEYQALCEDARRVEAGRDWLQEQLEGTQTEVEPGVRLEPPVAGLVRITRVEDGGVYGLNERQLPVSISLYDLSPDALGDLVRAVANNTPSVPDDPDALVRSLAALRRRAGR